MNKIMFILYDEIDEIKKGSFNKCYLFSLLTLLFPEKG